MSEVQHMMQQSEMGGVHQAPRWWLGEEPWLAAVEAERCLGCFDAPCIAACPTRIDIPRFIGRIRSGDVAGAYESIRTANALPAICALACPTEYLCEGACVLARGAGRPVQIAALQYHACSAAPFEPALAPPPARVAVVGAGPSGLACALVLRELGHGVDVFDRHRDPGGLLTYSIPGYRIPDDPLRRELERAKCAGISFRSEREVDAPLLAHLLRDYDAVYLALGLSGSAPLGVPGENLPGVWPALEYLKTARQWGRGDAARPDLGRRVVVIGGGNVAVDAASVAAHSGIEEVILLYRRTVRELPAWREEYESAARLGVQFRWLTAVTEIVGGGDGVRGVCLQRMELVEPDSSGRRGFRPIPGAAELLTCDAVIVATGQALQSNVVDGLGLSLAGQGRIEIDPNTGQTGQAHLFAGGDAVRGGSYVVQAVADGQRAARSIHRLLMEEARR